MKAKEGDVIDFISINWEEPRWEFDSPTLIISPILRYSEIDSNHSLIEDLAIEICDEDVADDEDLKDTFSAQGWNLKNAIKSAKEIMEGKNSWKTRYPRVLKQKIKFYKDDGDLYFKILEETEYTNNYTEPASATTFKNK